MEAGDGFNLVASNSICNEILIKILDACAQWSLLVGEHIDTRKMAHSDSTKAKKLFGTLPDFALCVSSFAWS